MGWPTSVSELEQAIVGLRNVNKQVDTRPEVIRRNNILLKAFQTELCNYYNEFNKTNTTN